MLWRPDPRDHWTGEAGFVWRPTGRLRRHPGLRPRLQGLLRAQVWVCERKGTFFCFYLFCLLFFLTNNYNWIDDFKLSLCAIFFSLFPLMSDISLSFSRRLLFVKFLEGDWVLDEPQFVRAVFLDVTALECQLPLQDGRAPADLDLESTKNRPLARWQIKVSWNKINAHYLSVLINISRL